MSKYFLIIILVAAFIFNSCGDVLNSDRNIIKSPEGEPPVLAVSAFPNNIGNYWVYQVYDANNNLIDTLKVKIFATQTRSRIPSLLWTFNYKHTPSKNYSRNITKSDSSVYEYSSFDDTVGLKLFHFPLYLGSSWYVGHSWDSTFKADTARVIEIFDKQFNNVNYKVYKIKRMYQINPGLYTTEYIEFIPGLGILTDDKAEFFVDREKLVLIDYLIK